MHATAQVLKLLVACWLFAASRGGRAEMEAGGNAGLWPRQLSQLLPRSIHACSGKDYNNGTGASQHAFESTLLPLRTSTV